MKIYIIIGFRKWNPSSPPETVHVAASKPETALIKFNLLQDVKTAAWFDHIFKGVLDTETMLIENGDF